MHSFVGPVTVWFVNDFTLTDTKRNTSIVYLSKKKKYLKSDVKVRNSFTVGLLASRTSNSTHTEGSPAL
jgi:hypothetical protein